MVYQTKPSILPSAAACFGMVMSRLFCLYLSPTEAPFTSVATIISHGMHSKVVDDTKNIYTTKQ